MWSTILNAVHKMYSPLLWRLTWINVLVIALFIFLSGTAIYNFACFLVDQIHAVESSKQQAFNETLFHYLIRVSILAILIGAIIHYYLTKKVMQPPEKVMQAFHF